MRAAIVSGGAEPGQRPLSYSSGEADSLISADARIEGAGQALIRPAT